MLQLTESEIAIDTDVEVTASIVSRPDPPKDKSWKGKHGPVKEKRSINGEFWYFIEFVNLDWKPEAIPWFLRQEFKPIVVMGGS